MLFPHYRNRGAECDPDCAHPCDIGMDWREDAWRKLRRSEWMLQAAGRGKEAWGRRFAKDRRFENDPRFQMFITNQFERFK